MAEGSARSIFADDGSRSVQARRDVIAPQGREVRVSVVLGEYAQKQGTQQVAGGMGAVAFVAKRCVGDQLLESSTRGQILREKYQRTQGADRRARRELRKKNAHRACPRSKARPRRSDWSRCRSVQTYF